LLNKSQEFALLHQEYKLNCCCLLYTSLLSGTIILAAFICFLTLPFRQRGNTEKVCQKPAVLQKSDDDGDSNTSSVSG